jgi:hypothetical protein
MMTSAVVLLMTRRRFVLSLKSAVNVPDAVGLSVSAGFAIRPPDPSANASSRSAIPRARLPSPTMFASVTPPILIWPPLKLNSS